MMHRILAPAGYPARARVALASLPGGDRERGVLLGVSTVSAWRMRRGHHVPVDAARLAALVGVPVEVLVFGPPLAFTRALSEAIGRRKVTSKPGKR